MPTSKRILVNGCSFSRGPDSWPYCLAGDHTITNLACAAAGNTYIHNATITELALREYDQVLIMWSGITRTDFQVSDISKFATVYTSAHQSQLNDWPEKNIQVDDRDYVEKNWVFAHPQVDKSIRGLSDAHFKHMGIDEHLAQTLVHMVSLQSVLKCKGLPYVFMLYQDYQDQLESHPLYRELDTDNLFNDDNIFEITKRYGWFAEDKSHPNKQAHAHWAQLLSKRLDDTTKTRS